MGKHVLLEKAFRYEEPIAVLPPTDCFYDMRRGYWVYNATGEAMMLSKDPRPLQTKKCDRETGEDQKGE
jgi:hypothetical protein